MNKAERLVVIGHRGKGMNALASPDPRLREVKENSLRSFNEAARFPIDFVEFDVQVYSILTPTLMPLMLPFPATSRLSFRSLLKKTATIGFLAVHSLRPRRSASEWRGEDAASENAAFVSLPE